MTMQTMFPDGLSNNLKVKSGQHTTSAAVDSIVTGLSSITAAVACLNDDPGDDPLYVSCSWSGGTLSIKTWKTDGSDPTPAAATTFSKKVSWIAIGV
jgi:hypothetical protein